MKKSGFTLIELLVVVAIIGIMASQISVNFLEARKKARDSLRINDVRVVEQANTLYYDSNKVYASKLKDLVKAGFINKLPTDPSPKQSYYYKGDSNSFVISALLESPPPGMRIFMCDEKICTYGK